MCNVVDAKIIDKLGWIVIKDNKVLMARSIGKDIFYIPGGKREKGESDNLALSREVLEEISIVLEHGSEEFFGEFEAPADRMQNTVVRVRAYFSNYSGELRPSREIEELKWVSYEEKNLCSKVTQCLLDALFKSGKIKMSINYKWIIFDADNTLFTFNGLNGLINMFSDLEVPFTNEDYEEYQKINKELWKNFRAKRLTLTELGVKRFEIFEKKFHKSAKELNDIFLKSMNDVSCPLPGALELLSHLKEKKYHLVLMTNGFRFLQDLRLAKYNLSDYFDFVLTSEEVGSGKPGLAIFEEFFNRAENPKKDQVLIIGDEYDADVIGGMNAGIQSCWFNPSRMLLDEANKATYTIDTLEELVTYFQ